MKPKVIVSVLDPSSSVHDVAVARAQSFAEWYGSDLHVLESGSVREVADYSARVGGDLVVVGQGRRSKAYRSPGAFAAAVGKAVKSPTIAIPSADAQPAPSVAPFRHILAAIDFSEASLRALSEAVALVQQSGGHLRVLHVLDGFPYETVYSGSRGFRLIEQFQARVARVDRRLQSLIPAGARNWSEIDVATVSGRPHEGILAAASEGPTDLIVLGASRRTRLDEFVAGSTARRVLRRAKSPVLLVPGPSTASWFRPAVGYAGQLARDPSAFGLQAVEVEASAPWR